MDGFLYTLTLQEPILANSLGGDPNSADSLFYVPGGAVRGAFIQAYNQVKTADDNAFRRLFLNGDTCYLNAYPVLDGIRSLPLPLKYKKPKYFESSNFGWVTADKVLTLKETFQVNIHTQRDAEKGHATSEAGAVYRYIALPSGMKLQGAVLTSSKADADQLKALLKSPAILLGKARTAGYGQAAIQTQDLPPTWREIGGDLSHAPDFFTLTLLSPAILRDENGQAALDIQKSLEMRLGMPVKIKETYRRVENIGGFNRTWGFPLPQVTAIAAGSVFEIEGNVSADKLLQLEATGLGERRAEGFGRVAVNLPLPEPENVEWDDPVEVALSPVFTGTLSADDPLAGLMLTRLLRRDLDGAVVQAARIAQEKGEDGKPIYKPGSVPNSQLSRWRVLLRDAIPARDIVRVQKFCQENSGKLGWKKMEKARIKLREGKPPRLTEWIELLLGEPDSLYPALGLEKDYQRKLGSTSAKAADFNDEYRLRLLDAVLASLAKQAKGGANE